jgi:hypothetical protein
MVHMMTEEITMSVTIHWRPLSIKQRYFKNGTSSDLTILQDVVGTEITTENIKTLRAMASAARNEFYNEVADAVEKYGDIKVWGEW